MNLARIYVYALAAASLFTLTGCGASHCTVSGNVTLDGAPLPKGRISLRLSSELARARPKSTTIERGEFAFASSHEIVPGSYIVEIEAWQPTGRELDVDEAESLEEHEQFLPPKYNTQSQLSVKIGGNTRGLLFELETPSEADPDDENLDSDEKNASSDDGESDILE